MWERIFRKKPVWWTLPPLRVLEQRERETPNTTAQAKQAGFWPTNPVLATAEIKEEKSLDRKGEGRGTGNKREEGKNQNWGKTHEPGVKVERKHNSS